MFSWVCSRCGHEVPPSKTECPFCAPQAPEAAPPQTAFAPPPPPPQYQAPQPAYAPPPQQAAPQQVPPPYAQQAPQYWQPQGPPPPQQYPPQQYPPQYAQQAPPQYWQPQQYPPQQYPPPPPQQEAPPPQPPQPQQYQPPPPPPPQQYTPAPPPYTPPAPVTEYKQPEPVYTAPASTPWPPPEEQAGMQTWMKAALAFVGVLALLGLVYFVVGSHSSSAAKDAANQQTTNPLQKYIEVVGIRIVGGKSGEEVKFLVVNHGGDELDGLTANVTLYASTQHSDEDSVGTFAFKIDSLGPNDSKELSAPLKTDKGPADMPDDWRNITADVQVSSVPQ